MKQLKRLVTNHWQAKLISLALALVLWAVVKKSQEATGSLFRRSGPEAKFDISQQADRCQALWDLGRADPCFISIEFTVWNVTPQDVQIVAGSFANDPRFVVVRGDQLFSLLRDAHASP